MTTWDAREEAYELIDYFFGKATEPKFKIPAGFHDGLEEALKRAYSKGVLDSENGLV